MNRIRLGAALLVGAVALLPGAAFAGDPAYQPYSSTDEAGDAGNPSDARLDILTVDGTRDAQKYKVVVSYAGVPKAARSRYGLIMYTQNDARLLEVAYTRNGAPRVIAYRTAVLGRFTEQAVREAADAHNRGRLPLTREPCDGAKVKLAGRTLTFVLPSDCLDDPSNQALVSNTSGHWTKDAWARSNPSRDGQSSADRSDSDGGDWDELGRG